MNRQEWITELQHRINASKGNYIEYIDLLVEDAEEIIALLKEQEAVVRCKDCKHGEECVKPYKDYWCHLHDFYKYGNWFCADGERKEDR